MSEKMEGGSGEVEGDDGMGKVCQEEVEGCSQMPELSLRQPETLHFPRKQHAEGMTGGGEGHHVGEENKHTDQLDSLWKPTQVYRLKGRKRQPRKIQGERENAGNNEEILLNQGPHQLPRTSSWKRPRKGEDVRGEKEVKEPQTEPPMTSLEGISSPQVAFALGSRRITRSLKAYLDQCLVRSADMHDHLTTMGDSSASKSSTGNTKERGISAAEIAFASESRSLTRNMKAYFDRCPVTTTPLKSPLRNVMSTATNKQDHLATMCSIPAAVCPSDLIKDQSLNISPTSLTCHNLRTTALSSEADNQNASVSTKLGNQSMSAEHGLLGTNEHAADLLTQNNGSGDLCKANSSDLEFIVANHQPVEEAHMRSNVTINTEKDSTSKSKKRGLCPSRSVSLDLTQMCLLMDDDLADFDEVGSRLDGAFVSVNGYGVKEEVAPILRDIFFRHGDIAKDCTFRAVKSRSCLLESVCGIYKRIEGANFMLITPIELSSLLEEVSDLETANIELGWLHFRLVEILEAKKGFKSLKEEKRRITEATEREKLVLEGYKKELEALEKKIHAKENALTVLEVEEEKLHEKFNNMKSNLKCFHRKSLVHGLL